MNLFEQATMVLEWPRLLDTLAVHARSTMGAARCRALELATSLHDSRRHQQQTTEMGQLQASGEALPGLAFPDIRDPLARAKKGAVLEVHELRDCTMVLELLEESQQSEAEIQRKLIDALAETDQTRLDTLAETVGVTPGYIMSALNNLIDLGLFAGAVAWDSGTVYPRKPGYSTALRACLHCGEPITIPARTSEVVCPICRTRHGEILTPNQ